LHLYIWMHLYIYIYIYIYTNIYIIALVYYLDLFHPDAQIASGVEWHLQVCDSPVNKYALQRDDQRVTLKLGQPVCFLSKLIAACNALQGPSATIRIFCFCHSWCWG